MEGWTWGSVGRMLAYKTCDPKCDPIAHYTRPGGVCLSSNIWETEQGDPQLHSESEASWGYRRPCFMAPQKKNPMHE